MALNGRCNPGDLCGVLSMKTKPSRQTFETPIGGAIRPCYYETDCAYILTPCTDIENPRYQTISDAITFAQEVLVLAEQQGKSVIIPVAEQQKVCNMPRDHWVTLHYHPQSKTCTLIDSRHWILSYPYSTKAMLDMLVKGFNAIGMDTHGIVFNQIYQNVQCNNVFCGSWTLMNSLILAGAIEARSCPESIEDMKTMFQGVSELDIINQVIEFSEDVAIEKVTPLTVSPLKQCLIFFGLSDYPKPEKSNCHDPYETTPSQIEINSL